MAYAKARILDAGQVHETMGKPGIVFDLVAGGAGFNDVEAAFAGGPQFQFVSAAEGVEANKALKLALLGTRAMPGKIETARAPCFQNRGRGAGAWRQSLISINLCGPGW